MHRYEQLSGSKKAMERVTILLCVNMSVSDKKKLVIGKSTRPRCSKGINMETVPVIYWANSNYCLDDERNISTMDYGLGCRSHKRES